MFENWAVTMLWSLITILRASLVQTDMEMAETLPQQQQPAVCVKFAFRRYGLACVSALTGLVTLTFDHLTLKLARKSHLRWGTFILNLGMVGIWVLELWQGYNNSNNVTMRMAGVRQNGK